MIRLKLLIIFTVLFLLASVAFGQKFSSAERIEKDTFPAIFQFTALGHDFSVDAKSGKTQRIGDALKNSFQIPLIKTDLIEKVYYAEFDNDLVLLYEVSEGGDSATSLIRLNGKNNKLKWKTQLPTFNIVGTLDAGNGYFAGVGFIGRINLANGKFLWKHDNIYTDKYGKIDVFAAPQVEPDRIVFKRSENNAAVKVNELVVDKANGRLLNVK